MTEASGPGGAAVTAESRGGRPSLVARVRGFMERHATLLVMVGYAALVARVLPWRFVLSTEPMCGGDTGSHFYPVARLFESGSLRPWNPGNLGGEPLLVHYFPLPFLVMAWLGKLVTPGFAFNWLTVLPTFLLPICVFAALRMLGAPRRSPLLALLCSAVFVYNDSYNAWGGNLKSTLSGQFAHAWALDALLLLAGLLRWEFRRGWPVWSTLAFAAVVLSHAYVALCLPVLFLAALAFLAGEGERWAYLRFLAKVGTAGVLLSVWWLWPSVQNAPWTTPYESRWLPNLGAKDWFPPLYWPYAAGLLAAMVALLVGLRSRLLREAAVRHVLLWLVLAGFYGYCIELFPRIGLVDIRAIPQLQLFLFIAGAVAAAAVLAHVRPAVATGLIALLAVVVPTHLALTCDRSVASIRWNWEGWGRKQRTAEFRRLMHDVEGRLDQPRVVWEHSDVQSSAGGIRAFELLPYFAHRSTLESLYMQATVLSPVSYYFQSLVCPKQKCPFPDQPCASLNLPRAAALMPFVGADTLILSDKKVVEEASKLAAFERGPTEGPWTVFKLRAPVSLVEVPERLSFDGGDLEGWKMRARQTFLEWPDAADWTLERAFLHGETDASLRGVLKPAGVECHPTVTTEGQELRLSTDCPGRLHLLKFAYHPSFRSSGGEPIFLAYPGYMALVPREGSTTLTFGATPSWKVTDGLSAAAWVAMAGLLGTRLRRRWKTAKPAPQGA